MGLILRMAAPKVFLLLLGLALVVAPPRQKRQEICVHKGCPDECPKFGSEENELCCPTQKDLPCCKVRPVKPCKTCDCGKELRESGSGSDYGTREAMPTRRRRLLTIMRARMTNGGCWWCLW